MASSDLNLHDRRTKAGFKMGLLPGSCEEEIMCGQNADAKGALCSQDDTCLLRKYGRYTGEAS
jgi:hypothetical protein